MPKEGRKLIAIPINTSEPDKRQLRCQRQKGSGNKNPHSEKLSRTSTIRAGSSGVADFGQNNAKLAMSSLISQASQTICERSYRLPLVEGTRPFSRLSSANASRKQRASPLKQLSAI